MSQNRCPLLFLILAATMLTGACGSATSTAPPLDPPTETRTQRSPTIELFTGTPSPTPDMKGVQSAPTVTESPATMEPSTSTPNPTPEIKEVQPSPKGDLAKEPPDPAGPISADKLQEIGQLFTLTGYAVAFPPEATFASTGGLDGTVKIWNLADGTLERELARLNGMIFDLVYSPDLRHLASAAGESVVVLDAADGETVARFQDLGRHVQAVAFSPDGSLLAAGGSDTIRIWNTSSWVEVAELDGHEGNVFDLAFTRDGTRLVSSGGIPDSTVIVWDMGNFEILHSLTGHGGDVHRLAISPDGQTVVTGGTDRHLKSWQVADGQQGLTLSGFRDVIYGLAYSPVEELVAAACGNDSFVMFWNPESGEMLGTLDDPRGEMLNVSFSPDGAYLATSNNHHEVIIWGLK